MSVICGRSVVFSGFPRQ